MKWYILIFSSLFVNLFFSCSNKPERVEVKDQKEKAKEIVFDKKNSPFNESTKIEILNYYFQIEQGDSTFFNYPSKEVSENYYPEFLDKKVVLDNNQTKELFDILYTNIDSTAGPAECYWPHHSILFYKGNEVIFYFHVCLSCHYYRMGSNYDFPLFDYEKWCELRSFFEKIGLNTTYTTEDEYACGRKSFDE